MSDQHAGQAASGAATDWIIDLTADGPVAEAAQIAVDELHALVGGGPWCVVLRTTGAMLAASGPLGDGPVVVIPIPGSELDLVSGGGVTDADDLRSTVARVGRLVHAVLHAEARAAAAERRANEAEMRSTIDALTGVLDQGEWWRRVAEVDARLQRQPRDVVIAIVDLDRFKVMNDTMGHLHGDLLLKLAARTIAGTVRAGDVVARVGGDEFAILAVDHEAAPGVLAARVSDALAKADIQASVGAAAHTPGTTLRATYDAADRAMYAHKQQRRRSS